MKRFAWIQTLLFAVIAVDAARGEIYPARHAQSHALPDLWLLALAIPALVLIFAAYDEA